MSKIEVIDLSFCYDGSFEPVFEHASFCIDTDWRLGFIGRNGRGKTTFCRLLLGGYEYTGSIASSVGFDYFPFEVAGTGTAMEEAKACVAPYAAWERRMDALLANTSPEALHEYGTILEHYLAADGYTIESMLTQEAGKLGLAAELLARPYATLSHGERTRLLLAALFCRKNRFLLIDEPTNHLDAAGRALVADYLRGKKGFLLVSHDRDLLDGVIDHVLSINKQSIEVLRGNYSVWKEQKDRSDAESRAENERLKKDISKLTAAARRAAGWSDATERGKAAGALPDDAVADRGFIGHSAAKMMKRAKNIERRREAAVDEKRDMLKNIELADDLKISPAAYHSRVLAQAQALSICYAGAKPLFAPLSFTVERGERVALAGQNGCGKSSVLRLLLGSDVPHTGTLHLSGGVKVSFVPQDTSALHGDLRAYAQALAIEESLFKAILRKLDFSRAQFEKDLSELSAGQKKKVLLAGSLCEQAHLYVWDEPLNFVDILSRSQIEDLLLRGAPAMLFVEHDARFLRTVATKTIALHP